MPIFVTGKFWNYISAEPENIINKCKNILTRKDYDFDTKSYNTSIYYQEISKFTIDGLDYITLRFPAGLTKWVLKNVSISLESNIEKVNFPKEKILEKAHEIQKINPKYEIRDYQIDAVKISLENYTSLITAGTGSGKTSILCLLTQMIPNDKILIMNGNNFILQQIYERLISFGETDISWNPSKEPDYNKRIVLFNTKGSDSRLNSQDKNYLNFLQSVNTWITDECFGGDTEILTNMGFKRFDELVGNELFANFKADTREIYFTPGKLIKKLPTSPCINWKLTHRANVILTAKHQQLYYNTHSKINKKDDIQNISFYNKNNKIYCSGHGVGKKEHLSNIDKILIALQADGCATQKANRHCYHVGLKKERKISNWEELLQNFNGKVVKLKSQYDKHNIETKRWHIWLPQYPDARAKRLYECFNISDFSYIAAQEFIKEVIKWDGWKQSKNTFGYISTDKKNTDFISAIATLAGYETYQENGKDTRKNNKNWFRIFFKKQELKSLQNCKRIQTKNLDLVYCVNVPEHNIVVRSGGIYQYTFISGNCHHFQSLTSFEPLFYMNEESLHHIVGYTASPFREYKNPYSNSEDFRLIALLGEPLFTYDLRSSIDDKNIAQPYGYFINFPNKKAFIPKQFEDNYYMQYRMNITYNKARNKAGLEMIKFLDKHNIKTLVSIVNIKPGQKLLQEITEAGIKTLFITGDEKIYEYELNKRNKLKLVERPGNTDDLKSALNNGYNIILGSSVLDEGVDIDLFQASVLFSAGKTPIAGLQRLGRSARKKVNGMNISFVIDFKDINGHPTFQSHYMQRRQLMEDSGVKILNNVHDFIELVEQVEKAKET